MQNTAEKLLHAAKTKLREEGKGDLVNLIDDANTSPSRPAKLRRLSGIADSLDQIPKKPITLPTQISVKAALAYLLEHNLTKEAYIALRAISLEHGANIWPSYHLLLDEKKECRPNNVQYSETAVVVGLQDRLSKNDEAFLDLCGTEIGSLLKGVELGGTLKVDCIGKAGFDGSTGHSVYNQKFSPENRDTSDAALLATCYVPLQYRVSGGDPVFTNPRPQSAAFCQPVRLEYRKETREASIEIDR